MPGRPTMDDRTRGNHFGIKQRMPTDLPQEIAIMPICPIHHRGDGNTPIDSHTELFLNLST
jgi:hypothetical protein